MYAGRIVESAADRRSLRRTRPIPIRPGLVASIPPMRGSDRGDLPQIGGAPVSLSALPAGCPFAPRCPTGDRPVPTRRARAARRGVDPWPPAWCPRRTGHDRGTAPLPMRGRRDHRGPRPGQALPHARPRHRPRPGRRHLLGGCRGDPRPGRRERLRQVHHGTAARPARAPDLRADRDRRSRPGERRTRTAQRAAPDDPDGLPGPLRIAGPTDPGRRGDRRGA